MFDGIIVSMSPGLRKHVEGMLKLLDEAAAAYSLTPHFKGRLRTAVILHDIAKESLLQKDDAPFAPIMHAKRSAEIAEKRFNICDRGIIDAIRFHPTGRRKMTLPEIFLYIIDFAEYSRDFPEASRCRELFLGKHLITALLFAASVKLHYVIQKKEHVHPDTLQMQEFYEEPH